LETVGSQNYVDMKRQNLGGTITEVKILLRFDRNSKFLTAQEKPPTNLRGQIAERNKTRINAFFVNRYFVAQPRQSLQVSGFQGRALEPVGGVRREASIIERHCV